MRFAIACVGLVACALIGGCHGCRRDLVRADAAYYAWDQRAVHCAVPIDARHHVDIDELDRGLDRARDSGTVLELYAHDPPHTVAWDLIEQLLAHARARGLAFVTYEDIAAGRRPSGGAVALSFDDSHVDDWLAGAPLFARYGARVTFWISRFDRMPPSERAGLHQLAAAGHAIEAHGVEHRDARDYASDYGVARWLADEVQPSIDELRAEGYPVHGYAYPFGARTDATDRAAASRVAIVRASSLGWFQTCPH